MNAPVLDARGLTHAYRGVRVLDGVGIAMSRGRIHALMGPSGSGKSTLVRLLHGLEPADAGSVAIRGEPLVPRGHAWLAVIRRCGLVQQRPGLLRSRVDANVAFPLRARGASRATAQRGALRALERVGLAHLAQAHAHDLSGGEAQRVGLARALVTRPEILFLDEATNQLDPESVRRVEDILREEAARGAALLLVTHSVAQARRLADDVTFLDRGRVEGQGPAVDILGEGATPRVRAFLDYG